MYWLAGLVGIAIGTIGAFGESQILWNTRAMSYPFKIVDMTLAGYYGNIADRIASYAPYVAVALGGVALLSPRWWKLIGGSVAVALCPMVYIFHLWINIAISANASLSWEWNGGTAGQAHAGFFWLALALIGIGLAVYSITMLPVWGAVKFLTRKRDVAELRS